MKFKKKIKAECSYDVKNHERMQIQFKGFQLCPIKFFPIIIQSFLFKKSIIFIIFQGNKEEMEAASKEVPYTFKGALFIFYYL